jgi:hypothetical protein
MRKIRGVADARKVEATAKLCDVTVIEDEDGVILNVHGYAARLTVEQALHIAKSLQSAVASQDGQM